MNERRLEVAIKIADETERADGCRARDDKVHGCCIPVDPALKESGWEWRCNADGNRLSQLIDDYQELGFEVRLERVDLDSLSEDCMSCKTVLAQAHALFTRRKG